MAAAAMIISLASSESLMRKRVGPEPKREIRKGLARFPLDVRHILAVVAPIFLPLWFETSLEIHPGRLTSGVLSQLSPLPPSLPSLPGEDEWRN